MSAARKPWAKLGAAGQVEAVRALESAGRANSTIAFDLKAPRAEVDRICAALRREREAQARTVAEEARPVALPTANTGDQSSTGGDDVERSAERASSAVEVGAPVSPEGATRGEGRGFESRRDQAAPSGPSRSSVGSEHSEGEVAGSNPARFAGSSGRLERPTNSPSDGDAFAAVTGKARLADAVGVEPPLSDPMPASSSRQAPRPSSRTSSPEPMANPERAPATPPAPALSSNERPDWRTLPTAERDRLVADIYLAGVAASKIAALFDHASRSAVCGVIHRLQAKGVIVSADRAQVKKRRGRAAAKQAGVQTYTTPKPRNATTPSPASATVIALPSAHGSRRATSAMVEAWLAKNGGPRRFEPRASTDILSIRAYLMPKGYDVVFNQRGGGKYTVTRSGPGRPKILDRDQFFAFVDGLRRADGLTPFLPQLERTSA